MEEKKSITKGGAKIVDQTTYLNEDYKKFEIKNEKMQNY